MSPRVPRTDRLTTIWMCLAVLAAALTIAARSLLPQNLWTTIHLVTLGVLSNAIFQWSWYFARALAHLTSTDKRAGRDNTIRIISFNAAFIILIIGMWAGTPPLTIAGATVVGIIAAWHAWALLSASRERLASRFVIILRYYIAAAIFLIAGATLAGFVTVSIFSPEAPAWLVGARDRLTVAHALVGVGGWLGLTMGGTLVTLGPTAMRTRMDVGAVRWASSALPVWVVALSCAAIALIAGHMRLASGALIIVALSAGVGVGVPLARAARVKGPSEYGAWSLLLGAAWIFIGAIAASVHAWNAASATDLRASFLAWLPIMGAAGVGQVFVGALTYLMPVVIGGGPSVVRVGIATLEVAAPTREALRNGAALLAAFTSATEGVASSRLAVAAWVLLLFTYAVDIVFMARSGVTQSRAKRERVASQQGDTRA